jgi:hypothetical protein
MTLGELKAAVMSTIGAEYTADIVRYLNKGLLELSSLSQVLSREDVTFSSGSGSVTIPSDCLIIKNVFADGYELARYESTDNPDTVTGTPMFWLKDETDIITYPQSEEDLDGQVVYVKRETTMAADSDTHSLTDADEFLIAYAKWKVLVDTRGLSDEATYWKQEAINEKAEWKRLNVLQNQRPHIIKAGGWM